MTADLSGIRSLLAGIEGAQIDVYPGRPACIKVFVTGNHKDALAAFIAAAPSTVARLLGIVEELLSLADIADSNDAQFGDGNGGTLTTEAIRAAITGEGGA